MPSIKSSKAVEPADICRLAALAAEIWREHFPPIIGAEQTEYMIEKFQSEEAMLRQVSSEGYHYRFLTLDGEEVGYFAYVDYPDKEIFLSKVYVRKDKRGNKLSRVALDWLVEHAREIGAKRIWLTVNRHNSGSIAVYHRFGFITFDEVATPIGDGFVMDDFFMEKLVHPLVNIPERENLKAIIFDVDGTLMDTLQDILTGVNVTLDKNGYEGNLTAKELLPLIGNGVSKLLWDCLPAGTTTEEHDKLLAYFQEHYDVHILDSTKPFEGMQDVVDECVSAGKKLAVFSNKVQCLVQEIIDVFFPNKFDFVFGARDNIIRKPNPDGLYKLLEALDVTQDECVLVGDTEVDLRSAENAGVPFLAVTWGFRSKENLERMGAKEFVDTPQEIVERLL